MMLARSLSAHAGVFLNNLRQARRLVEVARLQQQVEFAQTVQRQLLPAMDREIAGLDIAVAYLASNQVGGDYYDIFDIAPHTVCAVIADVSGHSIASGLLMTAARSALRLLVRHESQPAKILQQLNDTLYRDLDQTDLFISLFLVIIDLEAEVMRYASAGHNPALLYRCVPHDIMPLEATGVLMGFIPDASFDEITQPFQRGDALVLYTDGITEARNPQGEFFGETRLQAQVRHIGDVEARGIVGSIMIDVHQHTQDRLDDDMTLLVLKLAA
jgi:sigma-B regulation protein RsbU (phosphoserine phosphatase)